jgi:hypothetical protein
LRNIVSVLLLEKESVHESQQELRQSSDRFIVHLNRIPNSAGAIKVAIDTGASR